MDDLVKSVSETVPLLSQVSLEALRDSIADKLTAVIVERQLAEIRRLAIQAVRVTLLPILDRAMAEALAVIDHEDDAAWDQWKKVLGEAPVKN
jgi:hypothetical protein